MIPLVFFLGGMGLIIDATCFNESIHELSVGVIVSIFFVVIFVTIQVLKLYNKEQFNTTADASMWTAALPIIKDCLYPMIIFLCLFWFCIGYLFVTLSYGSYPIMMLFYGFWFAAGFSFIYYGLFMLLFSKLTDTPGGTGTGTK